VEEMLYFGCSGVTENDLENAATSIEEMLKEPGAEENILAQRQQWTEALEAHAETADELATLKRKREKDMDEEDSIDVVQENYRKALVELTKKVKRR
jgi:hypothetical protein